MPSVAEVDAGVAEAYLEVRVPGPQAWLGRAWRAASSGGQKLVVSLVGMHSASVSLALLPRDFRRIGGSRLVPVGVACGLARPRGVPCRPAAVVYRTDVRDGLGPLGARRSLVAPAGHVVRWACGRDGRPPESYAPFRRIDPGVLAVVLGLLRLGPRDGFVDFGCGDGAVVEAAGAQAGFVVGVELDPDLALRASARLHAASAAGRLLGGWRILHEPIGWTRPAGMTAGLAHLLPFAAVSVGGWLARSVPPGFRLVTVGGWDAPSGFGRRTARVDAVDAAGFPRAVELWTFGTDGRVGEA